jgi:hypothetical protein
MRRIGAKLFGRSIELIRGYGLEFRAEVERLNSLGLNGKGSASRANRSRQVRAFLENKHANRARCC